MRTGVHEPSEEDLREIGRRWLAWLEEQLNCLSLPAGARGCQHTLVALGGRLGPVER